MTSLQEPQDPREHELKTWPDSFEAVISGRKTHEWRGDDRRFAVNDRLRLMEFVPCTKCRGSGQVRDYMELESCCKKPHGVYTGRRVDVCVTFITRHPEFGVPAGWVVMSIRRELIAAQRVRDPRVDPRPGDRVAGGVDDEQAEVLRIIHDGEDCDGDLGPLPHVEARIDSRWGQRSRSVMSLETWRATFCERTAAIAGAPEDSKTLRGRAEMSRAERCPVCGATPPCQMDCR